MNKKIFHSTLY